MRIIFVKIFLEERQRRRKFRGRNPQIKQPLSFGHVFRSKIFVWRTIFSKYFWQVCQWKGKFEIRNPQIKQPLLFGQVFFRNTKRFGEPCFSKDVWQEYQR